MPPVASTTARAGKVNGAPPAVGLATMPVTFFPSVSSVSPV